jgi:hypothetical protein
MDLPWLRNQFTQYPSFSVRDSIRHPSLRPAHVGATATSYYALNLNLGRPHYKTVGIDSSVLVNQPDCLSVYVPRTSTASRLAEAQTQASRQWHEHESVW